MDNLTNIFMVLSGLALFLYGMSQLESGVRALGYDTFKRWISRSTASPARSAGLGAAVTAILQSSSLVSLLVLAFASAGVLPLYNAVGVLLGANLGTTVTGWMVASIGFKLKLSTVSLPLMATGAALQLVGGRLAWSGGTGRGLFGLGLIIFGLDVMRDAVAALPQNWDISVLRDQGTWIYFLAGAAIAATIQSSSATMMLTLAALNSNLLDLSSAAAVVVGADLGTTSTTLLGSLGGNVIKRQLALAHFLFNLVVDCAALLLLLPALPLLLTWLSLEDPLYSLVAFHSLFNLLGLLAFMPVLRPYSNWLGRQFTAGKDVGPSLGQLPTEVPEAALVASASALDEMRLDAVVLALHEFHLRPEQLQLPEQIASRLIARYDQRISVPDRYASLKAREFELLAFSFRLQQQPLAADQITLLDGQVREVRALVYSSKTQMDIRENIAAMRHTEKPEVAGLYTSHRKFAQRIYRNFLKLTSGLHTPPADLDNIEKCLLDNDNHFQESNDSARALAASGTLTGLELSSVLNVNRDIHHSVKDLLHGRSAT